MAGGIGRIARALVNGAMARQRYRAMHRVGLGGWKGDLLRMVGRMASETWRRRQGPNPPAPPPRR
ncbi:hypothetical protein MHZ93_01105 [Roseomonas sp. ACRSG]|nr:hypothetical protein [Roseomonas sp. ACRSG]